MGRVAEAKLFFVVSFCCYRVSSPELSFLDSELDLGV